MSGDLLFPSPSTYSASPTEKSGHRDERWRRWSPLSVAPPRVLWGRLECASQPKMARLADAEPRGTVLEWDDQTNVQPGSTREVAGGALLLNLFGLLTRGVRLEA